MFNDIFSDSGFGRTREAVGISRAVFFSAVLDHQYLDLHKIAEIDLLGSAIGEIKKSFKPDFSVNWLAH